MSSHWHHGPLADASAYAWSWLFLLIPGLVLGLDSPAFLVLIIASRGLEDNQPDRPSLALQAGGLVLAWGLPLVAWRMGWDPGGPLGLGTWGVGSALALAVAWKRARWLLGVVVAVGAAGAGASLAVERLPARAVFNSSPRSHSSGTSTTSTLRSTGSCACTRARPGPPRPCRAGSTAA